MIPLLGGSGNDGKCKVPNLLKGKLKLTTCMHVMQAIQQKNVLLSSAAKLATVALRRVFARLHVDDDKRQRGATMRPYARVISKIAMSSSFVLAEHIINRVSRAARMVCNLNDPYRLGAVLCYEHEAVIGLKTDGRCLARL